MSKLMIRETYINQSEGWQIGDSGWYEPFTDNRGDLYRFCRKEWGACISRCYIDTAKGTIPVGWVFSRRERYEDARSKADTYIREVWVEVQEVLDDADVNGAAYLELPEVV